nr:type II toxin-antitoxin system VapB family antitoxin [Synechococcus sp. A15-44]
MKPVYTHRRRGSQHPNPEADRLAAQVACLAREIKMDVVILALKERLQRSLIYRLDQIALRCAARPSMDRRSADEICGYDASGLPS